MPRLTKPAGRLGAAAVIAAVTFAVGVPAAAQDDTGPEGGPTADAETPTSPNVLDNALDNVLDDGFVGPNQVTTYAFLDSDLEGVEVGATVEAEPMYKVRAESNAGDDFAATTFSFQDSVNLLGVWDPEYWEYTERAHSIADYDNCMRHDHSVGCVVVWEPEIGKVYRLSDDSPLHYDIIDEPTTDDVGAYWSNDIDAEQLQDFIDRGYDVHGDNALSLVEVEDPPDGIDSTDGLFYLTPSS